MEGIHSIAALLFSCVCYHISESAYLLSSFSLKGRMSAFRLSACSEEGSWIEDMGEIVSVMREKTSQHALEYQAFQVKA